MTVVRLRLAPVIAIVSMWSTNLDVISVTSGVLCITMTVDEFRSFSRERKVTDGKKETS